MITLDTNVVSELMSSTPHPTVVAWLNQTAVEEVWFNAIADFEIRYGIEILEDGRRKQTLRDRYNDLFLNIFGARILTFSLESSIQAAKASGQQRRHGLNTGDRDALIAGIALANRAELATRNVRHFEYTGVNLINPWSAS